MNDFQELVYIRLQALPKGYTISIGNHGTVTKEEALQHVKNDDEIGKLIIQINKNYFNALKTGKLYEDLSN